MGTKIRFAEAGNEEEKDGHIVGQTIVFTVEEKPHDRFKREGDNLVHTVKIPLVEALTGPVPSSSAGVLPARTVMSLDGRKVPFKLRYPDYEAGGKPIKPGDEISVAGEGMPSKAGKGKLIVRVEVIFPDRIQANKMVQMRQALTL